MEASASAAACPPGTFSAPPPTITAGRSAASSASATAFGSCNVCLDFPDPIPDPPCLNPCDGIDGLLEDVLQTSLEDQISNAFVNRAGQGILIKVFSNQIVKDGCVPIPEVRECRDRTPPTAGLVRAPRDHGLNAIFYSLPLALAGVLALRLRRRAGTSARPE